MEGGDPNCRHKRQFDKGVNCHHEPGTDEPIGDFSNFPDVSFDNENLLTSPTCIEWSSAFSSDFAIGENEEVLVGGDDTELWWN